MIVQRIWDQAPHNAFTSLIRYKDKWLCAFREGEGHQGDAGTLRVITSEDGDSWHSAATLAQKRDLRDPKLSIMPDGRLMLNTFQAGGEEKLPPQSCVYFSDDGIVWDGPYPIGDKSVWLWRTYWHKGEGYSIGYRGGEGGFIRLYHTRDGKQYDVLVETLYDQHRPSEYGCVFLNDDTCLCLLRRDMPKEVGKDNALLGIAKPPYKNWQWQDLGVKIGGPEMIQLPEGRIIAAVRKYKAGEWEPQWVELCWLNREQSRLETILKLPSGGDCSYAGMQWHEETLWISYYSSHEEKTAIYLAKISTAELS